MKSLFTLAISLILPVIFSYPVLAGDWVFLGRTSTGESVAVDSQSVDGQGNFTYQIGNDIVEARANCQRNRWFARGYGWYSPKSQATQNMLNYVCNGLLPSVAPQPNTAVVFNPPSNVRIFPNGDILCLVRSRRVIRIYGSQGSWYQTDVCGSMGFIHETQVRF